MAEGELYWQHVVGSGKGAFPDIVKAKVDGGWLYASTEWDAKNDCPTGWSIAFVPSVFPR